MHASLIIYNHESSKLKPGTSDSPVAFKLERNSITSFILILYNSGSHGSNYAMSTNFGAFLMGYYMYTSINNFIYVPIVRCTS